MYGKVFESIFDSSLSTEGGFIAAYVMMSMVVLADENGFVDISYEALYSRLKFPNDFTCKQEFNRALNILESPDPNSNLPDEKGRRIIPLSEIKEIEENRGWLIVNYMHYRNKGVKQEKEDSRREYMRRYMASRRAKKKGEENQSDTNEVNGSKLVLTNVSKKAPYTDTDTDKKEDLCRAPKNGAATTAAVGMVFVYWQQQLKHPAAKLTPERSRLIAKWLKTYSIGDLCLAVDGCARTPHNMGENDRHAVYDGLNVILKNADNIERFMGSAGKAAGGDELV